MDSLYSLSAADVTRLGGHLLLKRYKNVGGLVMGLYPHHSWKPWLFATPPYGWFDQVSNQRLYFDTQIRGIPQFASLEALYQLTPEDLYENHGTKS